MKERKGHIRKTTDDTIMTAKKSLQSGNTIEISYQTSGDQTPYFKKQPSVYKSPVSTPKSIRTQQSYPHIFISEGAGRVPDEVIANSPKLILTVAWLIR